MSTFFHCNSWAKWIRKIYETDPLTCNACGESMRIIAFITDPREVVKILEHIGEQTSHAPSLMLTDPVPSFSDSGDTNFQYPDVPWYPDLYQVRALNVVSGSACSAALFADSQSHQIHGDTFQKGTTPKTKHSKIKSVNPSPDAIGVMVIFP